MFLTRFIFPLMLIGFVSNASTERKVDADFVQFKQYAASPSDPPAGYNRIFVKSNDIPFIRLSTGAENRIYTSKGITAGSILFGGTSGILGQDNASLFFDDANNRLGILTNSPAASLDVGGDFALRFTADASIGDVDALSTLGKGAIRLTGALLNLRGIDNGVNGKIVLLKNATGGAITIKNDNGNPSAEDRILTGTGADITINDGGAFIVSYDATAQRWSVIGGAGSGGGGGGLSRSVSGTRGSPLSITAVGGISFSAIGDEDQYIQGSGGAVDISATPQIQAGSVDGQRLCLIGRSNDNTVLFENGSGLVLNGPAELSEDDTLCVRWDGTNWVEVSRNI